MPATYGLRASVDRETRFPREQVSRPREGMTYRVALSPMAARQYEIEDDQLLILVLQEMRSGL
jgi:hypothetical protein